MELELRLSIWRRSWSWRLPALLHEPGQIGPLPEMNTMTARAALGSEDIQTEQLLRCLV
jgi:hypothetical protein